jgi:hypothetical protein
MIVLARSLGTDAIDPIPHGLAPQVKPTRNPGRSGGSFARGHVPPGRWRRLVRLAAFLGLAVCLNTGCVTRPTEDWLIGSAYRPKNVYGGERPLPLGFRRVAVLPLFLGESGAELEAGRATLEPVLLAELGKTGRFEVMRVHARDLQNWTGHKDWSASDPLPPTLFSAAREKLNCDGVLFAELTQYRPYPPLAVGWKLKLAEARTGEILWAVDEVFDASQPAVENGARHYQLKSAQVANSLADSRFILVSPTAFGHYTAEAVFQTLPSQCGTKVLSSSADNQAVKFKSF